MHEHIQKHTGFSLDYRELKSWTVALIQPYGLRITKDTSGERYTYLKIIFALKAG